MHFFYTVSVCALMALSFTDVARAQQDSGEEPLAGERPASSGEEGSEQDDIVITGRAVPGAVIGDIPPDNQLNPADIAAYGVNSVSELLDQISEQTQSGQGRDSSSGPVILVNGKRVSGVNEVGDLPTESILRVDILPEEVALKYGYGATQKVVNIILRRRFRSINADLRGELATEGQGEEVRGRFTYTRIKDNDRVNITAQVKGEASLLESERGIVSASRTATDPTGTLPDESAFRTLKPKSREYSLNGVLSKALGNKVTAVVNTKATHSIDKDLRGFASGDLTIGPDNPYAQSASEEVINRYLSDYVLRQTSRTTQVQGGVSVNATLPDSWQLSFTGDYSHSDSRTGTDRGYDISALQSAIDMGDASVDPFGLLPADLLGDRLRDKARARSDNGSVALVAMGKLFKLPAGDVRTSLRVGGAASALDSEVTRNGIMTSSETMNRSELNSQMSLDIPLTSRKTGFLGEIGTLTANLNASATRLSNFGTLGTLGYGASWSPTSWASLILSVNEDRNAPGLSQLNSPMVVTENVRVYDYVRGETVAVTRISGGNPDLKADDRHVFKLGVTVRPASKLTLSANYINSRTDDAIGTLPSITAAIEAAYPGRYLRNSSGTLIQVDNRPINLAREEQEQLRWGITFTKTLRAPTRPPRPSGAAGFRSAAGQSGARTGGEGERRPDRAGASSEGTMDGNIVVEGSRQTESDSPPPPDGFGPPWDRRPGGMDGMGPPPPGMGSGGPPGGFAGGPPPGGRPRLDGGNGATFQLSMFHSWYFRDRIILADGGPVVDLLNGGSNGNGGGQPRHEVRFNSGVMDNGLGLRLSGTWQSGTTVFADESRSSGKLRFSPLLTLDLRLFANLGNRFPDQDWARGTRVSFGIENLFNQRQRVRDETGATPLAYQPGYLDPLGRTVSLSIRRIF
ncbi:MAG: TonB-dependent receptor [Sphingobium sp.]